MNAEIRGGLHPPSMTTELRRGSMQAPRLCIGNSGGRLVRFAFALVALGFSPGIQLASNPPDREVIAHLFVNNLPIPNLAVSPLGRALVQALGNQPPLAVGRPLTSTDELSSHGECDELTKTLQRKQNAKLRPGESDKFLGICYFRSHRFDKAVAYLTDATRLDPGDKEAWIFLSRSYASSGRLRDAIGTLDQWLSKEPTDVDGLYWVGKFCDELAEQTYRSMAARNPGHYLVLELEGDQLRLKQEYVKALEVYRKAAAIAPNAPGLHFKVGDVYWRTLKLGEAKKELEKELEVNPFHAEANFELGDLTIKLGDLKAGVPLIEKAVMLNPRLTEAHRSLGRALLTEKQYEAALREFSIVANDEPADDTIHALLATTYRRMGRLNEAEKEERSYTRLFEMKAADLKALKAMERTAEHAAHPAPHD